MKVNIYQRSENIKVQFATEIKFDGTLITKSVM